ncbi:MAG: protein phosphatase 2C domain-containing protein [Lachnospiraceae bacterium]|nr:protein phosphatase 2C domain-containing protein [Lachnospiraceae bacterium]
MTFLIAASTDIGIAKQTNQDGFLAKQISTCRGEMAFAVLCDGMGGLSKGEVASVTVLEAFRNWSETILPIFCENGITDADIRREWTLLARGCNEQIKAYGAKNGIRLGTTLTAMLITQTRYYVINVGDTRAYRIREELKLLTQDQTLVAREVELGRLTEEEALIDPRRSVLLQCIGASDIVTPDFYFGDVLPDTVFLLCSDGFRHEIADWEIFQELQPANMIYVDGMRQRLAGLISLNMQRQERDNISAVAIRTI